MKTILTLSILLITITSCHKKEYCKEATLEVIRIENEINIAYDNLFSAQSSPNGIEELEQAELYNNISILEQKWLEAVKWRNDECTIN